MKVPVTTADLGLEGNSRIFINERLRPNLRPVFYELPQLKRRGKISTVYSQNPTVMVKVKKTETTQPVSDIEQFLKTLKYQEAAAD